MNTVFKPKSKWQQFKDGIGKLKDLYDKGAQIAGNTSKYINLANDVNNAFNNYNNPEARPPYQPDLIDDFGRMYDIWAHPEYHDY